MKQRKVVLKPRARDVFVHWRTGLPIKCVADRVNLSVSGTNKYIAEIYAKFGARSKIVIGEIVGAERIARPPWNRQQREQRLNQPYRFTA